MTHTFLIRFNMKSDKAQQKTHKDAILSTDWVLTHLTQSSKSHTCFYIVHFCVGSQTNVEYHKRTILCEYKTILIMSDTWNRSLYFWESSSSIFDKSRNLDIWDVFQKSERTQAVVRKWASQVSAASLWDITPFNLYTLLTHPLTLPGNYLCTVAFLCFF